MSENYCIPRASVASGEPLPLFWPHQAFVRGALNMNFTQHTPVGASVVLLEDILFQ